MDDGLPETLRILVALALTGLLVMLRLDAERFGTAEYYEATRDGEKPRIRRRLSWYALGIGIGVAILIIHPKPQTDFFLEGSPVDAGLAGHIGIGALNRFKVIFDYSRRQMILEAPAGK